MLPPLDRLAGGRLDANDAPPREDFAIPVTPATPADSRALRALYRAAFPTEDLIPLIDRLCAEVPGLLSLAARAGDGAPVGHIVFTPCAVGDVRVDLLGPLAVHPTHQRNGIGQKLIRAGLATLADRASALVLVLGDPDYYVRSGFQPTTAITPPYPLPPAWAGAWQARVLMPAGQGLTGDLTVPAPWREPALWSEG